MTVDSSREVLFERLVGVAGNLQAIETLTLFRQKQQFPDSISDLVSKPMLYISDEKAQTIPIYLRPCNIEKSIPQFN